MPGSAGRRAADPLLGGGTPAEGWGDWDAWGSAKPVRSIEAVLSNVASGAHTGRHCPARQWPRHARSISQGSCRGAMPRQCSLPA